MVKLKLRVGPKGQIVLPKIVREKLGIKSHNYVIADFEEDRLVIMRGLNLKELLDWLKSTRKPVARDVSRFGLEDEALETLP